MLKDERIRMHKYTFVDYNYANNIIFIHNILYNQFYDQKSLKFTV